MLNLRQSEKIVNEALPGWKIHSFVEHGNLFIFCIENPLDGETGLNPFFSVDRITGTFSEFAITIHPDFTEILNKFREKENG